MTFNRITFFAGPLAILVAIALVIVIVRGLAALFQDSRTRSSLLSIAGVGGIVALVVFMMYFFVAMPQRSSSPDHLSYPMATKPMAPVEVEIAVDKRTGQVVSNSTSPAVPPATTPLSVQGAESDPAAAGMTEPNAEEPDVNKPATFIQRRGQPLATGVAKPEWVKRAPPPGLNPARIVIHAGPEAVTATLDRDANRQLLERVNEYLAATFAPLAPAAIQLTPTFIRTTLVSETYTETQPRRVGPTAEEVPVSDQWLLVEINDDARTILARRWHDYQAAFRLENLTNGFALLLLCIGTVFGYLKFDQRTQGAYRGRLRAATVAIVVGVAILFTLAMIR